MRAKIEKASIKRQTSRRRQVGPAADTRTLFIRFEKASMKAEPIKIFLSLRSGNSALQFTGTRRVMLVRA